MNLVGFGNRHDGASNMGPFAPQQSHPPSKPSNVSDTLKAHARAVRAWAVCNQACKSMALRSRQRHRADG